jgi:transaldolase
MKFFVDTADVAEIRALNDLGLVDGVTTNPSLIAKSGRDMSEAIREICDLVAGPVSAEVTATDVNGMLAEAQKLRAIADNVTIKVPLTEAGIQACKALSDDGASVNVTLCFSSAQAILAAKAGAAFISPFVGRLDDIGQDGMSLIGEICEIYANYDFHTEVLVASVRHPMHVVDAARMGADVATVPPSVLKQMFKHPLTDKGLAAFLADWEKTGQSIL